MLSEDLRKLLIAQIGNELTAHQLYLGIALYFQRQSLDGWGKLFRDQSIEEAQHATEDHGLPDRQRGRVRPAGAQGHLDPVRLGPARPRKRALESERTVAAQFDKMAAVAADNDDHRGHQFLQWFIEEQVEEEAKLQRIVDLIDSGINLFQAEALLDRSSELDPGSTH